MCVSHPVGLTIVPDTVFLAALDVKDVAVVGFPNAYGTKVQAPIGLEAFSYDLTEVDLTSNINDPWYATTHTFISDALVAQDISPPDCLLFEAGLVKDTKVSDALASWRRAEIGPEMLPRFRHLNGSSVRLV